MVRVRAAGGKLTAPGYKYELLASQVGDVNSELSVNNYVHTFVNTQIDWLSECETIISPLP